jgi:hypothetical protein
MNKPRIAAVVLWILGIFDWVRQGIALPTQAPAEQAFGTFGVMALIFPVVFFTTAPLWIKGHPFDFKPARDWVNRKFGDGTYESYIRAIQPLALFAASAACIGLVGLIASMAGGASPGAYIIAGFFISSAVGFATCRRMLRKQGSTIE